MFIGITNSIIQYISTNEIDKDSIKINDKYLNSKLIGKKIHGKFTDKDLDNIIQFKDDNNSNSGKSNSSVFSELSTNK